MLMDPKDFNETSEMKDLNNAFILNVNREYGITDRGEDLQICLQPPLITIKKKDSTWDGDWFISFEAALDIWKVEIPE
jgi:hypothetical protein